MGLLIRRVFLISIPFLSKDSTTSRANLGIQLSMNLLLEHAFCTEVEPNGVTNVRTGIQ